MNTLNKPLSLNGLLPLRERHPCRMLMLVNVERGFQALAGRNPEPES
ncbi:MAG: hypothetical protein R3D62_03800 [Xanthobacteraceae bacterium]